MSAIKYSLSVLGVFFLFSCNENTKSINNEFSGTKDSSELLAIKEVNSVEVDKANTKTTIKGDSIVKEQGFVYKEFMFKIKTVCLNDSVMEDPKFNPAIISQKLSFLKNNVVVKEMESPARHSKRKLSKGKSTTILENIIYKVGTLEGENGAVFYFEGTGACNACTELKAFYTLEGEREFCFYGNKDKTIISYGDPHEVYKKYGINDKSINNSIDLKLVKYFY